VLLLLMLRDAHVQAAEKKPKRKPLEERTSNDASQVRLRLRRSVNKKFRLLPRGELGVFIALPASGKGYLRVAHCGCTRKQLSEPKHLGLPSAFAAANHQQQQQQQQHWSQLVSAYPKVTVDTLPAGAATAAGCSVCAGLPAATVGSGGSTALRGSVTAAAREVVALTAAPTLEVSGAAAVQLHKL
jgi:hypothetical protein